MSEPFSNNDSLCQPSPDNKWEQIYAIPPAVSTDDEQLHLKVALFVSAVSGILKVTLQGRELRVLNAHTQGGRRQAEAHPAILGLIMRHLDQEFEIAPRGLRNRLANWSLDRIEHHATQALDAGKIVHARDVTPNGVPCDVYYRVSTHGEMIACNHDTH